MVKCNLKSITVTLWFFSIYEFMCPLSIALSDGLAWRPISLAEWCSGSVSALPCERPGFASRTRLREIIPANNCTMQEQNIWGNWGSPGVMKLWVALYNNLESYDNLEFQVVVRNLEIDEWSVNPANIALWSSKTYAIISSHHKWVKYRRRTAIFFIRSIYFTKTTSLLWAFCVWWAAAAGRENVIIYCDILFDWPRLQLLNWSVRDHGTTNNVVGSYM